MRYKNRSVYMWFSSLQLRPKPTPKQSQASFDAPHEPSVIDMLGMLGTEEYPGPSRSFLGSGRRPRFTQSAPDHLSSSHSPRKATWKILKANSNDYKSTSLDGLFPSHPQKLGVLHPSMVPRLWPGRPSEQAKEKEASERCDDGQKSEGSHGWPPLSKDATRKNLSLRCQKT